MKMIKPLLISTAIMLSTHSFANETKHEEGEKIYKTVCVACHGVAVGGMDMNKRIAPPIAGVRKHYIDVYSDKDSFVQAISSWLEKQDESNSLMRGAIRKFKIMPPLSISKEDAEKVAAYIYAGNIEKPEGFEKHINKMHSKKGGEKGEHKIMQQLDLTSEQQQKMQPLMQKKQTVIKPLKKQLQEINKKFRELNTTSPDYKKQVFSLADQKSKLVYRMMIEKGEIRMNIEAILNPQQRTKFKKMRQKHLNMKH